MGKTITIKSGSQVISIESDNAGVPDTTVDAGPNALELHEDAQLPANNDNAEYNAEEAAAKEEVEKADVTANESFFDSVLGFSLEDGENPTAEGETTDEPVTPTETDTTPATEEPAAEPAATEQPEDGAGEVTETPGVTTITVGETTITIDNGEAKEEPAATEEPATETPAADPAAETPAEGCDPKKGKEGEEPATAADASIESWFEQNFGVK